MATCPLEAVVLALTVLALLDSALVEWIASFITVAGSDSWPDAVYRNMNVATTVWIVCCILAIVFLVSVCRGSPRSQMAARAVAGAGAAHVALFWRQIVVVNRYSPNKANVFLWVFFAVPGLLWIFAGCLFLAKEDEEVPYVLLNKDNGDESM